MVAVKDVKAMPLLSPYKGRRDAELEEREPGPNASAGRE
jgi:hypothetical protein